MTAPPISADFGDRRNARLRTSRASVTTAPAFFGRMEESMHRAIGAVTAAAFAAVVAFLVASIRAQQRFTAPTHWYADPVTVGCRQMAWR